MTTIEIYNILKQIDAEVMVNMALYLSEDVSRLSTPIDQILDLSKDYECKCTKSPKFCLGFALAYSYKNLYKNVMDHPNEKPNHKLETYPDYDRVIMDDCFREYIRRRTLIIHEKQFADQGFSQEVHQKCYEILYGELKEELQLTIEEFSCEGKDNIIMLVRRLKLFVEMELPMQVADSIEAIPLESSNKSEEESNSLELKPIVPSEKWEESETIKEELSLHISSPSEAALWIRKLQQRGQIEKDIPPKKIFEVVSKAIDNFNIKYDSFSRELRRK